MSSNASTTDASMPSGSNAPTTKTKESATDVNLRDASYDWILKSSDFRGTHKLVWSSPQDCLSTSSLVTGLNVLGKDNFNAGLHEWKQAMGSGDLEKYCKLVSNANLQESDNPMEATAWENGFVPEGRGLPAVELEKRIVGSLPHIAYMVSRPRQSTDAGEIDVVSTRCSSKALLA